MWQLVSQLVYTLLITNNHASFHLWRKEILVNYQKVSKYYVHDCRSPPYMDYLEIALALPFTKCSKIACSSTHGYFSLLLLMALGVKVTTTKAPLKQTFTWQSYSRLYHSTLMVFCRDNIEMN